MAELFLARDTQLDQLVVIKRILPYLSQEAEFVHMFLDEARIASQLHHPNIIEVFELGQLEESIFIAMEYVDGVDLRNILGEEMKLAGPAQVGTVPYGVAAWVTARICDGLHYAHNRAGMDGRPLEIIHRDISPQNVMVGYDGRVKLVDFGIARANAIMERSKPGVIKGKFLYLAPEQLTRDRLDHRADLFALGTMLYETTTGKSPFYKNSSEAVILAIRSEDPPPPHLVRRDYPVELSRIVMKCLTRDRTRRYQQANEISRDLTAFMQRGAPTDQAAVIAYVAALFGAEEERTLLHIPGRQTPDVPPARASRPHPVLASLPFSDEPEERTRPLEAPPPRRPTAEQNAAAFGQDVEEEEQRTQMARPADLEKALRASTDGALAQVPARRPTGQGYPAAGAPSAGEPTHTLTTGDFARPEVAPAVPSSEPPTTPGAGRPPSRTSAFVQDGPVFDGGALPEEPRTRLERRGAAAPWPEPGDVDPARGPPEEDTTGDFSAVSVSTVPGGAPAGPPKGRGRPLAAGLAAVAVILLVAAGAWLWRAQQGGAPRQPPPVVVAPQEPKQAPDVEVEPPPGEPHPAPPGRVERPPEDPVRAEDPAPEPPKKPVAARVPVVFRAPKGTRITVGKSNYVPGREVQVAAGTHRLFYACPRGYAGRGSRMETFEATGSGPQKVSISCKRK
jgi:serine/threonine protein kinase